VIFLLSSCLEKQGIPYRAAKQICIKGRQFQKGESFSSRASFQALAHCEAQQLEGINCLVVKSDDMLTIWREIPRHDIVLPAPGQSNQYAQSNRPKFTSQKSANRENFFNRSPLSQAPQAMRSERSNHRVASQADYAKTPKAKSNKHSTVDVQRLLDWIVDA
jgi:hypothetical protein